ncbi:MAG: PPE family protein [Mycobacterium sp.]|nr:PPE family protein [Mycobacterium sp.]
MTSPIWMASPPEVHSALLSSGPGPGPLLAAAGAWNALSAEYTAVADELTAVLAAAQAGAWQGSSAESYVASHAPYLAWLTQAGANSAEAAAHHETMAAAYSSALAAMPTLAELATNHMVHGALLATNFFGINTIPIALNELQYTRMWIQAAATMTAYQAVSGTAVPSTPRTVAAPQILKSNGQEPAQTSNPLQWIEQQLQAYVQQTEQLLQNPLGVQQDILNILNSNIQSDNPLGLPQWFQNMLQSVGVSNTQVAHDPTIDLPFDNVIAAILQHVGINWDPAAGTINGATYDTYANPGQAMYWVARSLELFEDFQNFLVDLTRNPVAAFQWLGSWLFFDIPTHILEVVAYGVSNPALALAAVPAIAPLGAVAGMGGLAGLGAIHPAAAPALVPAAPPLLPVAAMAPTIAAPAAPASGAPPAPPPSSPAAPPAAAPAPPPAASGGAGFFPPYAVGGPGIGSDSGMSAAAGARRRAPEPDSAAAAAAAAGAAQAARARRRRRQRQQGHGDEFLDMNLVVDPDWGGGLDAAAVASDRGAGPLGFAGTVHQEAAAPAAGLTTLDGGEFNGGPTVPMVPGTWSPDDAGRP